MSGLIAKLIVNDAEFDEGRILLSNLSHPVIYPVMYYPDAPEKIAEALIEILKESRF